MKIGLLSEKYTPDVGGLAISAGRLATLLSAAGHSVRVFSPTSILAPGERRTVAHNGITISRLGIHKRGDDTLVDWFEFIVEQHRRDPFDVLHAYFLTQAGFVAAYAGNYLGLPSVVSARGNDLERAVFDPARAAHILFALQHAGAVTTNAGELARKARALVPDLHVTLVPNGIDSSHFQPAPRNAALAAGLGLNGLPVIGFVGELREKKGLAMLLDGYAQLNQGERAALLIVGDVRNGEDRRAFDQFRALHSNLPVIVTGFLPLQDLPAYYTLIDVMAMPSLRDGLPNALLEGMACARAVVATPVGGIPDAIAHGENGRLVPVNDATALGESIEDLLRDKGQAERYGQAARTTIVNKFTPKAELDGNLGVYRRLGLKI